MVGEAVELEVHSRHPDEMPPYERLLGDAMEGDAALFARQDAVEAAWNIVDPVLDDAVAVHRYPPGSWGPAEATGLVADIGGWADPVMDGAGGTPGKASRKTNRSDHEADPA